MQGNVLDSVQYGNDYLNAQHAFVNKEGHAVICGYYGLGSQQGPFAIKVNENLDIDTLLNIPLTYDSLCSYPITNGTIPYDTTAVGVYEVNVSTGFSVYPNPFEDTFTLSFSDQRAAEDAQLTMFNVMGEAVFVKKILLTDQQIELPGLSAGIYLIRIETGKGVFSARAVKAD
jgi:hypothetical protein